MKPIGNFSNYHADVSLCDLSYYTVMASYLIPVLPNKQKASAVLDIKRKWEGGKKGKHDLTMMIMASLFSGKRLDHR